MTALTGHPEIDRQHERLDGIIARLEQVCANHQTGAPDCLSCPEASFPACNNRLADLIADLLGFMIEHFSYEEKLMRFLPDTELCRRHVSAHQQAHGEISRLLSELTANLDRDNPRQSALHLQHIAQAWMGGHARQFDSVLASSLEGAYAVELEYDQELIRLLANN